MDLLTVRNILAGGKSIYEIPLKVAYYARVSTEKDAQLHSLSAQKAYFEELIKNNPEWFFAGGYIDEGISGTSADKREQFLRMIADAENSAFDLIITKEISRFSRSTLDSIFYTQELLRHSVGVLFQNDNICTLDGDAELRLTIMASIAQDEVRKLSERCKFGFRRAIEKGTVLGNDRIWGYRKDRGGLIIVPEEAQLVKKIFEMYVYDGFGIRRIADTISAQGYMNKNNNPFSFSTVNGILSNPKYKGFYCGNKTHKLDYRRNDRVEVPAAQWVMYKDCDRVPPIVSEQLWDKANELMSKKAAP